MHFRFRVIWFVVSDSFFNVVEKVPNSLPASLLRLLISSGDREMGSAAQGIAVGLAFFGCKSVAPSALDRDNAAARPAT